MISPKFPFTDWHSIHWYGWVKPSKHYFGLIRQLKALKCFNICISKWTKKRSNFKLWLSFFNVVFLSFFPPASSRLLFLFFFSVHWLAWHGSLGLRCLEEISQTSKSDLKSSFVCYRFIPCGLHPSIPRYLVKGFSHPFKNWLTLNPSLQGGENSSTKNLGIEGWRPTGIKH